MKNKLSGFSLMEMLVVLLIIAIVMAASAPMVNRKMLSTMAEKSPWVWTNTTGSIAYNLNGNDNQTTTIGAMALPSGSEEARLYISNSASETPQIAIGGNENQSDTTDPLFFIHKLGTSIGISNNKALSNSGSQINGAIIIGNNARANHNYSVVIGENAKDNNGKISGQSDAMGGNNVVAIGNNATGYADRAIVIGQNSRAHGSSDNDDMIVIGEYAAAEGNCSIAIGKRAGTHPIVVNGVTKEIVSEKISNAKYAISVGHGALAAHDYSIAIGEYASDHKYPVEAGDGVGGNSSVAIGREASAYGDNSIAIGYNAQAQGATNKDNTIAIGLNASASGNNAVAIGAGAVANGDNKIVIGTNNSKVYIRGALYVKNSFGGDVLVASDRRLKNVGEVFTGGLEQIKKLEVFNYTFKKDTEKTPRVGVMAQDLQKIFPNAVFKGEDGFLRIRMEDMFYALVNAVKELDAKVQMIVDKNIAGLKKQIADLEEENRVITEKNVALEKQIASLYEQNAKLEERMNAIEKQLAIKKNK